MIIIDNNRIAGGGIEALRRIQATGVRYKVREWDWLVKGQYKTYGIGHTKSAERERARSALYWQIVLILELEL